MEVLGRVGLGWVRMAVVDEDPIPSDDTDGPRPRSVMTGHQTGRWGEVPGK